MRVIDSSCIDDTIASEIDGVLADWRQGDLVLGEELIFLHLADMDAPLSEPARELAICQSKKNKAQGLTSVAETVCGLVVVTQTCDIVRTCRKRFYVEVSPVVEVENDAFLEEIKKGRRPQYAYLAGVADKRLVVDLDRTMTLEKSIVAKWQKIRGCLTDEDCRQFALALARKRSRPAFPPGFEDVVRRLIKRLKEKHGKQSDEGRMLDSLFEIRVRAAPSWWAPKVSLTFLFVKSDDDPAPDKWGEYVEKWLALLKPAANFVDIRGFAATLDDLSARDLWESDSLDLDHMSP